ncbi:uncharacterized protein DUF3679 [Melghirimyces profundicolus]|uniref:Uncharacterized protein DUF3679 n=1 Tax=Melghirimyces profundicolus TaxID=1242148 RepID=A0A2T6C940_9BACL|nr:DUF3679 domain-containing protein [Melghirimyces profundicolus]PTX64840.1 uncharacterized protein DUF3679 [Melghirimyces profundicolus]
MRLMIQVLALMMVLMFGIFLGIDTAEQNIHRMQGSPEAPRAVHITPDDGGVEISVLGHVYETDSPVVINREPEEEEKKEPEEAEKPPPSAPADGSWLSRAGNQTGEGLKSVTRNVLNHVAGWIEDALQ